MELDLAGLSVEEFVTGFAAFGLVEAGKAVAIEGIAD
jgi:hypothetical protein